LDRLLLQLKGTLHTRKAGAAQSLLDKNKAGRKGGIMAGASRAGTIASGGAVRAQKFSNNKAKMKMIDVTEVQGLSKEHAQRDHKIAKEENREQKLLARKRKIMEAAAEKGLVVLPNKIRKLEEAAAVVKGKRSFGHQHNGGEDDDDDNDGDDDEDDPVDNFGTLSANTGEVSQLSSGEGWQQILQEQSNKLSVEDRSRIEQFFSNHHNPTPEQTLVKMKLHEERIEDATTGQQMKDTYYLELDYTTFTSKKSKKTKRY
jgi:hypothetical protein